MSFQNKVVIITGASSGIGAACARAFASQGAQVALAARREDRLKQLEGELTKAGQKAKHYVCDISQENQVRQFVKSVNQDLGPCDILVNNAGIGLEGPFHQSTTKDLDDVFNVNVRGLMIITREVLPLMIKRKTGAIINISSVAGKMGIRKRVIYCASKFAVSGFSDALLEEVRAYNIKVCNICPGLVHTDMHGNWELNRRHEMIQPEDVAEAVLLAASTLETCTIAEVRIRPRRPF